MAREYIHLMQGAYDWQSIMDRNGFDVALLPVGLAARLDAETGAGVAGGTTTARGAYCSSG